MAPSPAGRVRLGFWALLVFGVVWWQVHAVFVRQSQVAACEADETVLVGEVAGDTTVSQVFAMPLDQLSGVTVHARPHGTRASGAVEFGLSAIDEKGEASLLFRQARPVEEVLARDGYTWSFGPVAGSEGRRFRVEVGMPETKAGEGIGLVATRGDTCRAGALVVGDRERWSDLVFSTTSPLATAFGRLRHALRSVPAWLFSPWLVFLVFALYNAALAAGLWLLLRPSPVDDPDDATWAPPSRREWVVGGIVVALVAVAMVAFRTQATSRLEPGAIDLIARLPDADMRSSLRSLQDAFAVEDVTIQGESLRSIFAHPTSRIIYTLDVPPDAVLRTSVALRPRVWTLDGDGAVFRVGIEAESGHRELDWRSVQPQALEGDRRWFPMEMDLSAYGGQRVKLLFHTQPGLAGNAVNDACVWGAPRIVPKAR
jgi:hypothetical protein